MDRDNVLQIEHLTVRYDTPTGEITALDNVGMTLRTGTALAVVGESGSGKSTIALTLLDLLGEEATVADGQLLFGGRDLCMLPTVERAALRGNRISVVFQDPFTSLNPALTIGLQVSEPLVVHKGLAPRAALDEAVDLLGEVGIPRPRDVAACYPHQLSGGMQQRALIATALACEPELLILDEPTTALDVTIEAQILDLLEKIRSDRELSILFITHNLGVVSRFCEDVCVLYAGQVQEYGPTAHVLDAPLHPYTRGMLGSLPALTDGGAQRLVPIRGRMPDLSALPEGCIFHPRCPHAEARCAREQQALEAAGESRGVRCWKTNPLPAVKRDQVRESQCEAVADEARSNRVLVEVVELRKSFVTGRASLLPRMRRGADGRSRLRFERTRVRAVDGVDLAIAPGEVLGLVGESGSGKSTLGRCLVRLIEPSGGHITVNGQDVATAAESALGDLRRRAQIIFQNPDSSLNPRKRVSQIVERPLVLRGEVAPEARPSRVDELLDMVGLSAAYLTRYPHQLSGGEKQRVGIARALAFSPSFIVCDEPVSALDVSVQATILNLLADLRDRLGLAYLFISHDIAVVAHISSRIAVMYAGVICEHGRTPEVLTPPYHPYTEALLSAVPLVRARGAARPRIRLREDVEGIRDVARGCKFHRRCPRKLGSICEEEAPPLTRVAPGHDIACHIPAEELARVPPVIPLQ